MDNLIETFNSFNQRMKRPDRKRHLEICGFKYVWAENSDTELKPKDIAITRAKAFNEKYGLPAHVVYFQGSRNFDGLRHYEFWIKALKESAQ